MAERPQNYQNHARTFPLFHYIASPIVVLNFFYEAWQLIRNPSTATAWHTVAAFGLVALLFSARVMAITVQDRVIRLEMQLRLTRLLPSAMQVSIGSLTPKQLTALRFASDSELVDLVREIGEGRLTTPKEIKLRVKNWQADWLRA